MTTGVRRIVTIIVVMALGALATIGLLQTVPAFSGLLPAQVYSPFRRFVDSSITQRARDYIDHLNYFYETQIISCTDKPPVDLQIVSHESVGTRPPVELVSEDCSVNPGRRVVRASYAEPRGLLSQSADGRYIVHTYEQYVAFPVAQTLLYVNRVDTQTNEVTELFATNKQTHTLDQPLISADGRFVALTIEDNNGNARRTWWFNIENDLKQATGLTGSNLMSGDGQRIADFITNNKSVKDIALWNAATNKRAGLKNEQKELEDIYHYFGTIAAGQALSPPRPDLIKPRFEDNAGRFLSLHTNYAVAAPNTTVRPVPRENLPSEASYFYVHDTLTGTWHLVEERAEPNHDWRPPDTAIQNIIATACTAATCPSPSVPPPANTQKLFVTSATVLGNIDPYDNPTLKSQIDPLQLTSTAKADAVCNVLAMEANQTSYDTLPSDPQDYEWRAFLSTGSELGSQSYRQASSLIRGAVTTIQGDILSDDFVNRTPLVSRDTIFQELSNAFRGGSRQYLTNERGEVISTEGQPHLTVWTGSGRNGRRELNASENCSSWTDRTLNVEGEFGELHGDNNRWFRAQTSPANCETPRRLYCISTPGEGTVVVPTPSPLPSPSGPPAPACGNGRLDQGEQCDDGNTADGDGCSNICQREPISGPYQSLFVTSTRYNGGFTNSVPGVPDTLIGANRAHAMCNLHALQAGLTTYDELPADPVDYEWLALLAAPSQPAPREMVESPVYNLNRQEIAADAADLWDVNNTRRVITDETGGLLTNGNPVWTGGNESGDATSYTCSSWTSSDFLSAGSFGISNGPGTRWFESRRTLPSFQSCSSTAHLYCLSRAGASTGDGGGGGNPEFSRLHNQRLPADVNDDGQVTALDLVELISGLRQDGPGPVTPAGTAPPYLDVNNDFFVDNSDVVAFHISLASDRVRAEFVLDQDGNQEITVNESIQAINQAVANLGAEDPLHNVSQPLEAGGPALDDIVTLLRAANQEALRAITPPPAL